ncbi:hypothetical protein [Escherichia coli]|uniref:hypothetical protein n=1 Tax=Escherichia coli TaxID=562 RepID=UPI001482410F|nr:hypothetical protein [Escherichia coli]NNS63430.1 hypothetical protein [Escherichia coli]NNS91243.1 hypothetical protein [Escherichia coli]NNS96082.1 hypothetical protein [Escherichia coli]NNT11510.1 hypothetical protein [Escherichia coli]NNT30054.1 hypothetical protein [Escherichia coli]
MSMTTELELAQRMKAAAQEALARGELIISVNTGTFIEVIEALETAERRSAEYEGMVFVPVEPTLDQLVAGKRRLTSTGLMSRLMSQRLAEVYRAMVGVAVEGE